MNYEERYTAALERAKERYSACSAPALLEYIFPELKVSEDEKIRKAILQFFESQDDNTTYSFVPKKDILTWLEKQGEQKPYGQRKECEDCQFNYAGECKGFCQMKRDEQKPADNVEQKFKVGDWVVYDHRPYQVVKLPKEGYINLGLRRNGKVEFAPSPYCRHWTIQDAKDGDVLACNINKAEIGGDIEKLPNITPTICIYQNVVKDKDYIHSYCSLYDGSSLVLQNRVYYNTFVHNIQPATEEQRELLFQKMKEEGWEYDNEKKELKKIKSKTLNADKVIEWLNNQACQGWIEDVEVDKFVDKFKKDFGL